MPTKTPDASAMSADNSVTSNALGELDEDAFRGLSAVSLHTGESIRGSMLSRMEKSAEVGWAMNGMQGVCGRACVPRGTISAHAQQAQEVSAVQAQQAARRFRRLSVGSVHLGSGCCSGRGHSVDRPSGLGAAHWCRPPPPRYKPARHPPWQPLWGACATIAPKHVMVVLCHSAHGQ
jgi:hypothetical protein